MPLSKNVSLLRAAVLEADALATRVAQREFPVLLRPIADLRNVTSVDFCPLLVDAMLVTHSKGFRILLNSDGKNSEELKDRYYNESHERMMISRLRFSLAHELAHTFFFDITKPTPQLAREFTAGGKRTALDNLELNCNILASHLLLPTAMFEKEFLRLEAVTPESILNFARKAGVSLEAFLRRLGGSDSLFIKRYFRGCIVLVNHGDGEIKIRSVAKPKSLNIARHLLLMRPGQIWKLKAHDGTEMDPTRLASTSMAFLDVVTERSVTQKQYRICVAEVKRFEGIDSYLLTFEEI